VIDLDTDADGLLDSVDPDDDNDGTLDAKDAFALDPAASIDTDGDGKPDDWNVNATPDQIAASLLVIDDDDDNDGVLDVSDNCRVNANPGQEDANNNGIGDICESDELCFPVRSAGGGLVMICL
jgi:hypothetical protein